MKALLMLDAIFNATGALLGGKIPFIAQVAVSSATTEMLPFVPNAVIEKGSLDQASVVGFSYTIEKAPRRKVRVSVNFSDVLYLQYTGESPANPKGPSSVPVIYSSITCRHGYRVGEETVASAFPMFHIGGAAVMFNTPRSASIFIVIADPRTIDQCVAEMKAFPPAVIANVPALFQMLVNSEALMSVGKIDKKVLRE